jgi:hypothetical protein
MPRPDHGPEVGSATFVYKDPVRSGPDTPLPRTRRSAVVLFVGPQLDRFASVIPTCLHIKSLKSVRVVDLTVKTFEPNTRVQWGT